MRGVSLSAMCALIWLIYWAAFWFAKLSQRATLRGLQYRVTAPLATWAYVHLTDNALPPEQYRSY